MLTKKIDKDGTDVLIKCPHCTNTEKLPVDGQRERVKSFKLVKWLDDVNDNEVSIMQCNSCNNSFELVWDYTLWNAVPKKKDKVK